MSVKHVMALCVAALVAVGCLFDVDDVCGAHQRRVDEGLIEGCVCDDGAVPNKNGIDCHPCGEHELVKAEACVCEPGFARADPAADCTPMEEQADTDAGVKPPGTRGQDMSCATSSDCAGTDATYCLTLLPPSRCLVQMCGDGSNLCAEDRECCVITVLPELAATGGLCVDKGMCMAPGMVVTP